MEISYREKQKTRIIYGCGIEVRYKNEELPQVEQLAKELEAVGCKYHKSPFPKDWKPGHQAQFFKPGSEIFQMFNQSELDVFKEETFPIIKKYDSQVTKKVYLFDND